MERDARLESEQQNVTLRTELSQITSKLGKLRFVCLSVLSFDTPHHVQPAGRCRYQDLEVHDTM